MLLYSTRNTYTKIGTIQRRLAWPLRKDDTQNREAFHIFMLDEVTVAIRLALFLKIRPFFYRCGFTSRLTSNTSAHARFLRTSR